MEFTAHELATRARQSIRSLALHPDFGNPHAVCRYIAESQGLSLPTVRKFYDDEESNPTVDTLDKIRTGIRLIFEKAAA